jgi:glucose-6-phosphate 1-dehydrogenase
MALTIIIFGASGDLTRRKLLPALSRLAAEDRLPADTAIVGVARSPLSDEQFRERVGPEKEDRHGWERFRQMLHYVPADATTAEGLKHLSDWLTQREGPGGGDRLYYLAVAPQLYGDIIRGLGEAGLAREAGGWRRLVIEKPFGEDLDSARALHHLLHAHFREDQVYRIDHYMGKETVQNLLVFRFANTLFEPLWDRNYIDHVQITVAEKETVGTRGPYYDTAGVLRDMFQNHLLQLLTLVAMEAPARFEAGPFRNEMVKLLESVQVPTAEQAAERMVCGQYEGYRAEKGVRPDSATPTFAAVQLWIANWRWQNVPFYLRSGKGLTVRRSEVVVQFRCPPHLMFALPAGTELQCNRLSLCIQPDEGIHLSFQSKVPGQGMVLRDAELEFHYRQLYGAAPLPEAYERLLLDALQGDATLFIRNDNIERAWEIMDPLIVSAEQGRVPCGTYPVGSSGPSCADEMLAREGRSWLSLCQH